MSDDLVTRYSWWYNYGESVSWVELRFTCLTCGVWIQSVEGIRTYSNSPPQSGLGRMCRLDQNSSNKAHGKPFVKISANWDCVGTCNTFTSPSETVSRTKWRSTSTCFVCWCCTGLVDKYWALTLSQYTNVARRGGRLSSVRSCRSQQVSETAFATALYSASALECETVCCRFDDQATRLSPN